MRGPTVFGGYLQNREVEADVFDEEGWFCTGDLAFVKSDGYICLVGRLKDVILCGGENVYTSEVEAALHMHPGIEQAAVFGVPHTIMGELVQAAVTLRKDSNKCGEPGDTNQGPGSRLVRWFWNRGSVSQMSPSQNSRRRNRLYGKLAVVFLRLLH